MQQFASNSVSRSNVHSPKLRFFLSSTGNFGGGFPQTRTFYVGLEGFIADANTRSGRLAAFPAGRVGGATNLNSYQSSVRVATRVHRNFGTTTTRTSHTTSQGGVTSSSYPIYNAGTQISSSQLNSTDKYFLFTFYDTIQNLQLYGWGQLNVSLTDSGPDVTLVDYAYDTSGAPIAAGDVGAVPEPSYQFPLSLGALVLGAVGVRRWRAKRAA